MTAALPEYLWPRVLLHPPAGTGMCTGRGWQGKPRESMATAIRCSAVDSAAGGKAGHIDWQRRKPMGAALGGGAQGRPHPRQWLHEGESGASDKGLGQERKGWDRERAQ